MKYFLSISLILLYTFTPIAAQTNKAERKSPPITMTYSMDDVSIALDYSSPSIRGRELWGGLVPLNKVWRTGANEATKITLSQAINIEGEVLEAGTYSLFTIPSEETWTIIFNKVANQWGNYDYDEKEDSLRVNVKPTVNEDFQEAMIIEVIDSKMEIKWGNIVVPVKLSKLAD